MYKLLPIICILLSSIFAQAQPDTALAKMAEIRDSTPKYYRYDSVRQMRIPVYDYSGKWDFDGDGKNDALVFIGTGGAHAYYYLQMHLSSQGTKQHFRCLEVDMPYLVPIEEFRKKGRHVAVQFVVHDFDSDRNPEVYLNIPAPKGYIPKCLKTLGLSSSNVFIDQSNGKLLLKNFEF